MRVAFTGTQRGMTPDQFARVQTIVESLEPEVVRHGDCIGADAEFHRIVYATGYFIVIHPPADEEKRAFCKNFGAIVDPQPYLVRNHAMVDSADLLIAAPAERVEQQRSGTWATIRYARKRAVPIIKIYPDGSSDSESREEARARALEK